MFIAALFVIAANWKHFDRMLIIVGQSYSGHYITAKRMKQFMDEYPNHV